MKKIFLNYIFIAAFFLLLMYGFIVQAGFSQKTLIFNLDQSFANGIINMSDTVALERIILTLNKFKEKYEVYVLIQPNNIDQSKIIKFLDYLTQNNIPFIMDAISSDVNGMFMVNDTVHLPHDAKHGIAISVEELAFYKNKYGRMLAGLRFHELFTANYAILACQIRNENWCDNFKQNLPSDNFYQKQLAEPFVRFAKNNDMFVLWSDWFWSAYQPWDFSLYPQDAQHPDGACNQLQNEQDIKDLAVVYPDTIIIAFANNTLDAPAKIDKWYNDIFAIFSDVSGIKGFVLSDQSWMCAVQETCPAEDISLWARKAFASGALAVQFEPVFYFWQLPSFTWRVIDDYTINPDWSNRGYPTDNMIKIASDLGVNLNQICKPAVFAGCKVCKSDGSGWVDNDSKCPSGQICISGKCQATCVAKTCAALGNYQCGSWSDGCGKTINCGTCPSGQTCSAGKCVANCTGRAAKKCDSGNLYWYNSCGQKEELAQNCAAEGKICSNGVCVSSSIVDPEPKKEMTRDEILTRIQEIRKMLIQLIIQLIAELQKQIAAAR